MAQLTEASVMTRVVSSRLFVDGFVEPVLVDFIAPEGGNGSESDQVGGEHGEAD